jgi:hypothetical protein
MTLGSFQDLQGFADQKVHANFGLNIYSSEPRSHLNLLEIDEECSSCLIKRRSYSPNVLG